MKIWHTNNDMDEYEEYTKNYSMGDIEIITNLTYDEIWIVIDNDFYDSAGPHFNGDTGATYPNKDTIINFENITNFVKVIKPNKISRKVYKGKVWKETKEWMIVKI